MNDQPIHDPQILEAMEACRPGSDDLSDPDLAFLSAQLAAHPDLDRRFERIQHLDAKLAEAFHDVPVPEGLADRILAEVAAAQNVEVGENAAEALPCAASARPRRRYSRRVFASLAAAAGIAAAVALVLIPGIIQPELVETDWHTASTEGISQFATDRGEPQGEPLSTAPAGYPFSSQLKMLPDIRWRRVEGFLGRSGIAYDFRVPGGTRATLYVVDGTGQDLPQAPAFRPQYETAQAVASAWRENQLVYVLVTDVGRYQQFLKPRGPIT